MLVILLSCVIAAILFFWVSSQLSVSTCFDFVQPTNWNTVVGKKVLDKEKEMEEKNRRITPHVDILLCRHAVTNFYLCIIN